MRAIDTEFRVIRNQSRLPRAERERWPASLPWAVVERWRAQIELNHGPTLERLHERGGLAPRELWLAAHGLGIADLRRVTESEAGDWLIGIAAGCGRSLAR